MSLLRNCYITKRETSYRRDIQVLRGLAVLAVVLFHAFESHFPLGYLGVDVFFVISGFVVTPLILRIFSDPINGKKGVRSLSLSSFYKRRFYRLAPAMLFMLCTTSIFVLLFVSPTSFKIFGQQAVYSILALGNYGAYKLNGDYFTNSGNPLIHSWSLSVEEQIYVFLPLITLLLLKLTGYRNITKTIKIAFCVFTCLSLAVFSFPPVFETISETLGIFDLNAFSFYSPLHRTWQFTLGGIGYFLTEGQAFRIKHSGINQFLILFLIVLLFASLPLSQRGSSVIASFLTLVILCFQSLDSFQVKLMQPFEWLGDRSYSIYLFHMPITFIVYFSPYLANRSLGTFRGFLAIILSILFGSISYSKVEKKCRISKDSEKSSPNARLALVVFLFISLLGSNIMIKGASKEYWGLQKNQPNPRRDGI